MKVNAEAAKNVLALMTLVYPSLQNEALRGLKNNYSPELLGNLYALRIALSQLTHVEDESGWEQRVFESIDPNVQSALEPENVSDNRRYQK